MNPKLKEAVAIFKELGWENVTPENILDLPLGTKEQKQTALAGLRSGEWGDIAELSERTFGWRSYIDVEEDELALFAVRVGVDAQRAANILFRTGNEMPLAVIAARGAKFASDFIGYACTSKRRAYEHSASVFGNIAVRLVDMLDLDVPKTVGYMKDWSVYAAAAMGLKAEVHFKETDLPSLELIEKHFVEHIQAGIAVGAPGTGPFGGVLPAGVKQGWLSREEAVNLTFLALDASVRPSDRKVWLAVLDELAITDEELGRRTQALIPLLATGDSIMITRLAPVLIAQADDDLLVEVLLATFSTTTKKAKQLVLKVALERPCPEDAQILTPWLSIFASDTNKSIASLATQLMTKWNMDVEELPEEKYEMQGLWQETPPVWQVPSFDLGEVSPEALTELTAELVSKAVLVHDVTAERFLAMANAVAYENPEAARISLRGLRSGHSLLELIAGWVKGENPYHYFSERKQPVLFARDYMVAKHLDKLPCILSTPSAVDLSIHVTDLIARLARYQEMKVDVLEADLFLALTRLDMNTKTTEAVQALHQIKIPIVLQSGEIMSVTAGEMTLIYLENPIKEPSLVVSEFGFWSNTEIFIPEDLQKFTNLIGRYQNEFFSIFPHWGDVALSEVRWDIEVYHDRGLVLRQVARRSAPLPPSASINMMAAQRSGTPDSAEDAILAVSEAWGRGLLRPGVADIAYLDWKASPPSNLAAFSSALDGIARDGMLSVVWPVLDDLVVASIKAPRLFAGTAELVDLIADFLPEVQFAIEQGLADDTALDLPGIRALAQRSGSSRTVTKAREIAVLLPVAKDTPKKDKESLPVMEQSFDEIWTVVEKPILPIDDGVTITVDWVDITSQPKLFLFTLKLPEISDQVFQVVNSGWYYGLEREGACDAYAVSPDTTTFIGDRDKKVWLHWDEKRKAMVVCDKRNWFEGKDSYLQGIEAPLLSSSLLTVIIGLLAQDGDAIYYAPELLRKLIKSEQIGTYIIRKATQNLLQYPAVSPAKLVRTLEKDRKLLYVLWPMLTESIKAAGKLVVIGNAPPVWVNRVLDVSLRYAPYLIEAAKRGLIPSEDAQWLGLSEIALSKSKSTAVGKAKKLLAMLR